MTRDGSSDSDSDSEMWPHNLWACNVRCYWLLANRAIVDSFVIHSDPASIKPLSVMADDRREPGPAGEAPPSPARDWSPMSLARASAGVGFPAPGNPDAAHKKQYQRSPEPNGQAVTHYLATPDRRVPKARPKPQPKPSPKDKGIIDMSPEAKAPSPNALTMSPSTPINKKLIEIEDEAPMTPVQTQVIAVLDSEDIPTPKTPMTPNDSSPASQSESAKSLGGSAFKTNLKAECQGHQSALESPIKSTKSDESSFDSFTGRIRKRKAKQSLNEDESAKLMAKLMAKSNSVIDDLMGDTNTTSTSSSVSKKRVGGLLESLEVKRPRHSESDSLPRHFDRT